MVMMKKMMIMFRVEGDVENVDGEDMGVEDDDMPKFCIRMLLRMIGLRMMGLRIMGLRIWMARMVRLKDAC